MTTKVYLDHTITAFDPAFLKSYQMRAFGYSFYSNICPSTSIFYFFSDISSFMFWGVFKYIKCLQKNNPQFSSSLSFKSHRGVPSMKSTVTPITSNFFHIPFCSITSVFFQQRFPWMKSAVFHSKDCPIMSKVRFTWGAKSKCSFCKNLSG